jgi:ubiquinone/menaquinone biosynthesis C-methylase UbiE
MTAEVRAPSARSIRPEAPRKTALHYAKGHPVTGGEETGKGIPIHWARAYDFGTWFMYLGRGRAFREKVLDLALVRPGEAFLDVGCGPGRLVDAARERVGAPGAAWGVDMSPEMIRLATRRAEKKYPYAEFAQAPAQKLSFDTYYFDAITTVFVMHHIPGEEEKRKAFREMHRVLRKGGRLVVVDFKIDPGSTGILSRHLAKHMEGGELEGYRRLMSQEGFTRVDTGEVAMRLPHFVRGYAE